VSVENAEMVVTAITRLTPPEVAVGELHYGVREPWSVDGKRIKFFEWSINGDRSSPPSYNFVVWAFVDDLRKAKTLDAYLPVRHNIHPNWEFAESVWWCPFAGEENIVYALHRPTQTLVRWNVDTETGETVVSYRPDDGGDVSQARLMGWTTDNKLICNLENETRERGAWEIDVAQRTRRFHANADGGNTAADMQRWPSVTHGHSGPSPDHTRWYGDGTLRTFPGRELIFDRHGQPYLDPPASPNHFSWRASNKWWIANDAGVNAYALKVAGQWPPTTPHIDTIGIYQCWIDGTCKRLLQMKSASFWDNHGEAVWNWVSEMIPTVSRDGRQVIFVSTDGKYSAEDHERRGVEPWGYNGLFLIDLATK
jgi:hypothetical protein